ncbi:PAS domain-containing protein [Schaalia sp. 19OD2882]|uniref:PAS domain-containing protein n=1 Tax=Schaalia sp. 19OD2882 TaxID=2794089 RepID=UPI001C1EE6BD|nr:PAS domain-containing protein [Schaalia sp. 19OD2882]QWW20162.1 PAS domain-containing protein [Schaalia sp. 19OD2882]
MTTTTPTGATHEVGVDDLFFSTTDARGVIQRSNEVFVELSRHPREELTGAPHNIIRHPDMPGGAFRAMWDTLESGEPFAAYVRNLAGDGSEYDVFATVTPLPDGGYLSVRSRVMNPDIYETVLDVYRDAREVELAAMANGMNRRDAAVEGVGRIVARLGDLGLGSYEELQLIALPEEVTARAKVSAGLPTRPGATGQLAELLTASQELAEALGAWTAHQEELVNLASSLRRVGADLTSASKDRRLTPDKIAALDRSNPTVKALGEVLDLWTRMQGNVQEPADGLLDRLSALALTTGRVGFRIALARLHTNVIANFAAELIDGVGDHETSVHALPDLAASLRDGMTQLDKQSALALDYGRRAVTSVDRTAVFMEMPHQLLTMWTQSNFKKDLPADAALMSQIIERLVIVVDNNLKELHALSRRCVELGEKADLSLVREKVFKVCAIAESITN